MAAAQQADDFALDWDLPDYPQLPKMFTSAKAAKKRKHKEFILTDADLDTAVKIPKVAAAAGTPKKSQAAAAGKHSDADMPPADAAALSKKAEHKRQKREANKLLAQQAAVSPGANKDEAAPSLPADPAPKEKKKKRSSKVQEQQQQQQQGAAGVAAAVQQQPDGSSGADLPKKSRKNKFKMQEFLQQQEQQQQQQQQADKPNEQQQATQKHKAATQQQPAFQQQQQQQPSPGQPGSPISKKQKQKLKKAQQQQQQVANGTGNKAAAAPAAAAGTKVPSLKERSAPAAATAAAAAGGSKLMQQFKERLQGSRFRQLNEALYSQPGDASFSTMQQQPQLFEQYHEGFQQQVKAWPSQPLDAAIKWLQPKSADWVVADFGCGEARLAASVQQTVHSLDLVAVAPGVIECNMAHTPLETASCDVAVFSLALMGTDYGSFLLEASRVIKPGGWLWVAEVRSRFADGATGKEDFRPLLAALKALGFRLVQQDAANRMFVVWVLQKKADSSGGKQKQPAVKAGAIKWPPLRACVYKKR